jgi:hypothetical protein
MKKQPLEFNLAALSNVNADGKLLGDPDTSSRAGYAVA